MTDTEIVDWLQENLMQVFEGTYRMITIGATCVEMYSGGSLRECVEVATKGGDVL